MELHWALTLWHAGCMLAPWGASRGMLSDHAWQSQLLGCSYFTFTLFHICTKYQWGSLLSLEIHRNIMRTRNHQRWGSPLLIIHQCPGWYLHNSSCLCWHPYVSTSTPMAYEPSISTINLTAYGAWPELHWAAKICHRSSYLSLASIPQQPSLSPP